MTTCSAYWSYFEMRLPCLSHSASLSRWEKYAPSIAGTIHLTHDQRIGAGHTMMTNCSWLNLIERWLPN